MYRKGKIYTIRVLYMDVQAFYFEGGKMRGFKGLKGGGDILVFKKNFEGDKIRVFKV